MARSGCRDRESTGTVRLHRGKVRREKKMTTFTTLADAIDARLSKDLASERQRAGIVADILKLVVEALEGERKA